VHWLPPVLVLFFYFGSLSVEHDFSAREYKIDVRSISSTKNVKILRSFERWVLVRDERNAIVWIPMDDIGRMELVQTPSSFRGLVCIFSKRWCPRGPKEESSDG